ncbi:RHS repeat domain-containing protein [Methylomonas sp. UP202]|uniref:RHS repeat domain-containing protein n=1 Tax=Methylomonas sp. UP202 TaxID=3040943 RepID=UPI00247A458E|nr:RHS repeat domain-containing protein [Methylomonas sp. UP202]WGS88638.1 RHS repeat protein [Methylomonas sp. UP202]
MSSSVVCVSKPKIHLDTAAIRRRFFAGLFLIGLMGPAWAGSVAYTYDTLGRITQAAYSTGVVIAYYYDAAGNRSSYVISGAPS